MVTISFTLSDSSAQRVINAWAAANGYQAQISNENGELIPNPQPKSAFVKEILMKTIKNTTLAYEREEALKAISAVDLAITTN